MKRSALLSIALAALTAPAFAAEIDGLPQPAAARPIALIAPKEETLANGLRVIVVERTGVPLLNARLLVKTGSESDPDKLGGLAGFAAELLTKGTATRTAPEIARQIESLGASLDAGAGWDAVQVKLTTLTASADAAFAILADVVRNPKFAPDEIERARHQVLDELRVEMEKPGEIARRMGSRAVLGASGYAHAASGTPASIARIKRADLAAHHARTFTPANALLIIAGSVKADEGFALAEKAFGDWSAGRDAPAAPAKSAAEKPRAILIDMPHAGQAAVYFGAPGLARNDASFAIAEVTNAVLGVGYSSRLNQEVRVKRGLSYGAASKLLPSHALGLFAASCQTKNESAAEVVRVIQGELKRLATEPVPADYLVARKAVLTGNFSRELETNEGYVKLLTDLALHGLPLDSPAHRVADINAVSADDVRAFAEKHLLPDSMSIIVAGRAKDVAKPLHEIFPKLEIIPQNKLDLDAVTMGKGR